MAVASGEKLNFITRIKRSFRNMYQEMKKVHWPSKRDLSVYTFVVICVSLIIAFIIYLMDLGIGAVMDLILLGRQ